MNLVGAGTNAAQNITTHDVYTIGQFKDDQVQEVVTGVESEVTDPGHRHYFCCGEDGKWPVPTIDNSISSSGQCICVYSDPDTQDSTFRFLTQTDTACTGITVCNSLTCNSNSRTGSTTHGKNYGVFYVIKAVTGITELDDAEVYAQVVDLLESSYIQKSLFNEGGIPMYNSTTECFDQITPPVCNGLALSYDVTNCCYCWANTTSIIHTSTAPVSPNILDTFYNINGVLYYGNKSLQTLTPVLTDEPVLTN